MLLVTAFLCSDTTVHSQINPPEENRQLPGEAVKESITITSSFLAGKFKNRSLPRIMTHMCLDQEISSS